ncbi:MAG: mechanosensitive ion channel domain-containing protein [Candidatus Nanohaloarchaea archaeon]
MPTTRKILQIRGKQKKSIHSVENIVGVIGLFITFTVGLQAAKFGNLATILGAIAAALTVAVGFGMRDQISSLVAGILIQLDNPFVKGDYIKVNDQEGKVKEINLRTTIINGKNNEKLVLPNNVLTLWTRSPLPNLMIW